jgi:hypothetical protein
MIARHDRSPAAPSVSIRGARTADHAFPVDGVARIPAEAKGRELDRAMLAVVVAAECGDEAKGRYRVADAGEGRSASCL